MATRTKLLNASAYLFGIPALYIILALDSHSYHGARAMRFWCGYLLLFFSLRFFINLVWQVYYWPPLAWLETAAILFIAYHAISAAVKSFHD